MVDSFEALEQEAMRVGVVEIASIKIVRINTINAEGVAEKKLVYFKRIFGNRISRKAAERSWNRWVAEKDS